MHMASKLVDELRSDGVSGAEVEAALKAKAEAEARAKAEAEAKARELAARGPTFSVAILGEPEVGKTTLINSWKNVAMRDALKRTQTPTTYSDTTVTISDGRRLTFRGTVDVGGQIGSLPQWDKLVDEGRWVLYLVDARRVAPIPRTFLGALQRSSQRRRDLDRLEDDADRIFKRILARESDENIPQVGIVVVLTHTDLVPSWRTDPVAAEELAREELFRTVMLLGGDRRVRFVWGSLADLPRAKQLTDRIAEHLLRWEP
jgi:GTPase SAR1 family protein